MGTIQARLQRVSAFMLTPCDLNHCCVIPCSTICFDYVSLTLNTFVSGAPKVVGDNASVPNGPAPISTGIISWGINVLLLSCGQSSRLKVTRKSFQVLSCEDSDPKFLLCREELWWRVANNHNIMWLLVLHIYTLSFKSTDCWNQFSFHEKVQHSHL